MNVRPIVPADLEPLAVAMGRAFETDPVFCAILPDEAHRRRAMPVLFRAWIRLLHLPHAEASFTTDDHAGGVLWSPPGTWHPGLGVLARMGPSLIAAMGPRVVPALRTALAVEALHPRRPHMYLRAIGCAPERQGQGVGSSLMRPMLARLDAEGLPAYLESSNEKNVPLYERHGFAVTAEHVTRVGPRVWLMWREPRARE